MWQTDTDNCLDNLQSHWFSAVTSIDINELLNWIEHKENHIMLHSLIINGHIFLLKFEMCLIKHRAV